MTGPTLVQAAVDELYAEPLAEFVARRKALATAARKAGDKDAATQIAALRKPTLSADTLNRLVRAAPEDVDTLMNLGVELRAAEKALDADAMRELTGQRRSLVGDLTRLAFDLTDQASPSPSVRDEVTATLNAALADEQIADRLLSGALVTQARWDGFGSTSLPELATVIPLNRPRRAMSAPGGRSGPSRSTPAVPPAPSKAAPAPSTPPEPAAARPTTPPPRPGKTTKAAKPAAPAPDPAEAKEKAKADRKRQRQLDEAREAAAQAQTEADRALQTVEDLETSIGDLTRQLARHRELLATAQKTARAAETRRRETQLALTRAGGG